MNSVYNILYFLVKEAVCMNNVNNILYFLVEEVVCMKSVDSVTVLIEKESNFVKPVHSIIVLTCRAGIVQPSHVGEDGKPHPVEHILELVEGSGAPEPPGEAGNADSD